MANNTYFIRYTYGKRFYKINENGEKLYTICEGSGWYEGTTAAEAMQNVRNDVNDNIVSFSLVMRRA